MTVRRPSVGEDFDQNIHSASWLGSLVDEVNKKAYSTPPGSAVEGLELAPITLNGTPVNLQANTLVGAVGFTATATDRELRPKLQATLGRAPLTLRVTSANFGDATVYAEYLQPGIPYRLKCRDTTADVGYKRKFVEGAPCGRRDNEGTISAGEGGLILLTKPFKDPAESSGDYYCWAMLDTVEVWDAVIIKPASGDSTQGTAFLDNRSTYVAGIIAAKPYALTADLLKDEVTNCRVDVHPRDPSETYEDGTHVLIRYIRNEFRVIWSSCSAISGLTGKAKEPA
jgi:hypothetical protein